MKGIDTSTLAQAYKDTIQYIVWPQNHVVKTTQDGELVWRSKDTIVIHVDEPNKDLKRLIDYYPMGPQAMESYVEEIIGVDSREVKGSSDDFCYTYNERLMNYEILQNIENIDVHGIKRYYTRCNIINQIDEIVKRLNESPTSRRAVANTWNPYKDNYVNARSPPCLQNLKCEIVDGKLNMFTYWRSRDALLGLGANIYAINRLHNQIADACGVSVGFYEDINVDAHIYYKRDANYLKRWL